MGIGPLGAGLYSWGPNSPDGARNSRYECGFEAFEDARMKFDVRYYLVAILFILFDSGTGLFAALGGSPGRCRGMTGFVAVLIFLAVLVVGFAYEWKKGALDWE